MAGLLKRLFGGTSKSTKGKRAPNKSDRLNVLAGTFPSEIAATDYALGLTDGASLSGDLGGGQISADDVEIIHGRDRVTAARAMLSFVGPCRVSKAANTFLLLSDRGYKTEGMKDERVVYLGQCTVS